jgi:hypothetical protein
MAARFRLVEPEPLEVDIHEQCARALDRLLAPPAMWCCYPAGGTELSAQQWARYARMGLKRGMPDLFVFYDGLWGIELKRRGGRLSKTRVVRTRRGSPRVLVGQEETFPALIASKGFRDIAIAHSVEEVLDQIERWRIPLRGRIAV